MKKKITILYVDDEPINIMLFKQMFEKKYTVHSAESGFDGLKMLEITSGIEVIISDMRMPGMNGLEFIKKAKAKYPEILFYILTGYSITPEIQESLEIGLISRYFQKPFNLLEIDSAIHLKIFGE